MQGLIIHDRHSFYDFGAVMTARNIGYPKEIKVTERVPYSNTVYDFSYLYGEKTYTERTLVYELSIREYGVRNRIKLNFRANAIVHWLQQSQGKVAVVDTYSPEYHFRAECTDVAVEYEVGVARITATFAAYPFRIPNEPNNGLVEVI